jgi:hypothetical protein
VWESVPSRTPPSHFQPQQPPRPIPWPLHFWVRIGWHGGDGATQNSRRALPTNRRYRWKSVSKVILNSYKECSRPVRMFGGFGTKLGRRCPILGRFPGSNVFPGFFYRGEYFVALARIAGLATHNKACFATFQKGFFAFWKEVIFCRPGGVTVPLDESEAVSTRIRFAELNFYRAH